MHINDLFTDLCDGKFLMKLLEIISGEKIGRPNKGMLRVQKMENVNRALTFLMQKVSLVFSRHRTSVCSELRINFAMNNFPQNFQLTFVQKSIF